MKTTLHILIDDLRVKSKKGKLNPLTIIKILEDNLYKEREQTYEAFTHGIKYGHSQFQTADYPHAHYYTGAYEETAMKIHAQNEKIRRAPKVYLTKSQFNKLKKQSTRR